MATNVKNATFSLPVDLLERLKEYVKNQDIPSLNAGVKEALEEYSKKIEKEKLRKRMAEASQDPLFMKDLENSMKAFEDSDAERVSNPLCLRHVPPLKTHP
jgi:metal-responsive CopG/Arc/MetJ family transcriptional regulator